MTEGSILRSVEFPSWQKKKNLQGESLTGSRHTQIGNRPEAKLFPTRDNLLKYTAIYPGADFNVVLVEPYQPMILGERDSFSETVREAKFNG